MPYRSLLLSLRRVAGAWVLLALLATLAACGGGDPAQPQEDVRVADSRVPLRYEVAGLRGSGGYAVVRIIQPDGGGDVLTIPLNANGSFQTDTDPFVEHSGSLDGLYPQGTTYALFNQDSWPPSNPTQVCTYSTGPLSQGTFSPPQPIDAVLRIDCSAKPLRYEVRGLLGSGASVVLVFSSPTDGVVESDLRLTANGTFSSDTDDQPGPEIRVTDPDTGAVVIAPHGDGLLQADSSVRAVGMTQPTGPAQVCTVSGVVPGQRLGPLIPLSETLIIDCSAQPLRYEVRGLQGSGASVSLVFSSPTHGVAEVDLLLTANGTFSSDTDDQPGPQFRITDPDTGSVVIPPYGDGLLPANAEVRALEMTQPTGPDQICTVNGHLLRQQLAPLASISDTLVIDCGSVYKQWRFDTDDTVRLPKPPGAGASGEADTVEVSRTFTYLHPELFGPAAPLGPILGRAEQDLFANLLDQGGPNAGMYSSADGRTYWIATEAGNGPGTHTTIETRWGVRKIGDDPKFTLTLSALQLAGQMSEGSWYSSQPELKAYASLEVRAHRVFTGPDGKDAVEAGAFHHQYDAMELLGRQVIGGPKHWILDPLQYAVPGAPIFINNFDKFVLTTSDGNGRTGNTGHAVLREPIGISVDLKPLGKDERALIVVRSKVTTRNRFNNESMAVAYLRDPVGFDPGRNDQSMAVTEISGLAMFSPPLLPGDFALQPDTTPAAACTAADAPRAVLQFGAATYAAAEDDPLAHVVTITRTGSSQGEVTARVRVLPGSAQAGVDYLALETVVRFADGDANARRLPLQLIDDQTAEGLETLTVVLDQPGGCADIGPRGTTTVTVLDDEQPPTAAYTIGGTVTGLAGGSLEIDNAATGPMTITANGAFQFPRTFLAGHVYLIQVSNQPQNPRQTCTVANGEGTITNANIDNVQISCTTLADPGGLDPSFGTGGIAWTSTMWPHFMVTRLARQADGKLLVAGGTASLLRLLPDGTPDAGFGTAGNGLVTLRGASADRYAVNAVAVQPDGRIVAAGSATIGASGRADMMVARWMPDGTLDTTFAGGAGVARVDHAQWNDGASQVLLQADGSILAVGGSQGSGGGGNDFTVLRLTSAGAVDTGYGTNGWARIDVGGGYDAPRGAVLTPDGGVVLVGRVGPSGGSNGDIGMAKFTAAGVPDTGFGSSGNGTVRILTAVHDEASDVAVLPDGRLLVVGERQLLGGPLGTTQYELWLARYLPGGQLDTGFGSSGVATHATQMRGRALAVRADGAIWVAGETPSTRVANSNDFALARFTAGGQSDGSFGTAGVLPIDLFGGSDTPGAMLQQPDGRLVLAGQAYNGANFGLGVVRVTP